jgi:peptide methionine sulfoxide reductase MsrA
VSRTAAGRSRHIADVEKSHLWPEKLVTLVELAVEFWKAEPEHQEDPEKYPDG